MAESTDDAASGQNEDLLSRLLKEKQAQSMSSIDKAFAATQENDDTEEQA